MNILIQVVKFSAEQVTRCTNCNHLQLKQMNNSWVQNKNKADSSINIIFN